MGKVGKTFTLDMKLLLWLEESAKKENKSESAMVNSILQRVKRQTETWECSICGVFNDIESKSCYTLNDDVFCAGVRA